MEAEFERMKVSVVNMYDVAKQHKNLLYATANKIQGIAETAVRHLSGVSTATRYVHLTLYVIATLH